MKFTAVNAINTQSNAKSRIWVGDYTGYINQAKKVSEVQVDGKRRLMLSGLLKLAQVYTIQLETRKKLGHDCITFAYSWDSGDTYDTAKSARKEDKLITPRLTKLSNNLASAPQTQPGEIVYTVNAPIKRAKEMQPDPHFMIHATTDRDETLYLSKFGSIGPIILTTFRQSLQLYPAQTSGVAYDFKLH